MANFRAIVFGCLALLVFSTSGVLSATRPTVNISNNGGGVIIRFALKMAEYQEAGTLVKFSGRCDSACTLFLGLPHHQTCIKPNAYFRFHAPSAGNARAVRVAQAFMMRKYPSWVLSWIKSQGGLSRRLIKMNYAYASRFVPTC